jgi:hypothetical protein
VNRSISDSPYRWDRCGHGHPVSIDSNSVVNAKKKLAGGWYIRHHCYASECGPCSPGGSLIYAPCSGWLDLKIPDNPAQHLWAPYPRQTSTQWRDSAALLPRTDGVYTWTVANKKEVFKPRVIRDRCLVFTPEGDVVDMLLEHDGYGKEKFREKAADIAPRVGKDRSLSYGDGVGMCWRGLYAVTGTELTCSLTEVKAEPYTITGKLNGDVTTLKVKKAYKKAKMKYEYTFRPIA